MQPINVAMPRLYLILLFALCMVASLSAEVQAIIDEPEKEVKENEIDVISRLVGESEKHLATQKRLKQLMKEFQEQKETFLLGNQTKSHAYHMVMTARQILDLIHTEHLSYLFSSDYLDELVVFSSIAGKSSPVRP